MVGLLCDFRIAEATGFAEREVALQMLADRIDGPTKITLGADKAYDTRDFFTGGRSLHIVPHVAQHITRSGGSAIDARTTR